MENTENRKQGPLLAIVIGILFVTIFYPSLDGKNDEGTLGMNLKLFLVIVSAAVIIGLLFVVGKVTAKGIEKIKEKRKRKRKTKNEE